MIGAVEWSIEQYQRQCDYWCAREEAIEKKVEELMEDDYSPEDGDNFCEAIAEASDCQKAEITKILSEKHINWERFGMMVYDIALDYWSEKADEEANRILDTPWD